MKLTKTNLKQIIKEELRKALQGQQGEELNPVDLASATIAFIMDYITKHHGGGGRRGLDKRSDLSQKWMKANQQLKIMRESGDESAVTDGKGKIALARVRKLFTKDRELFNHFLERGKKTTVSE